MVCVVSMQVRHAVPVFEPGLSDVCHVRQLSVNPKDTPPLCLCVCMAFSECLKNVVIVFALTLSVSQCHAFIFGCLCCRQQQI